MPASIDKSISRRRWLASAASIAGLTTTPIKPYAAAAADADVLIIGAGLSGLHAALLLEEIGLRVKILEARSRVGGRIFTLSDKPEMPETGGSEIGNMYARVLDTVERFGLRMEPWSFGGRRFLLHIDGQTVIPEQWEVSPLNRLSGSLKTVLPPAMDNHFMPSNSSLPELDSWLNPTHHDKDVSLHDYYVSAGASKEALHYLGLLCRADDLHNESYLWNLRKLRVREFGRTGKPLKLVVGGMSRVPEMMAGALRGDILLDTLVTAISQTKDDVKVTTSSGGALKAHFAICTLPLPVLRTVALDPNLPKLQAEAVNTLPYGQATNVYFEITDPFWEADGLPASLWSDGPLGRVYKWSTPNGTYVWVYLNGRVNRLVRHLPDADVLAYVEQQLFKARPSMKGRIRPITVRNWSADPYSGGTFAYWAPGQIARFGNVLAEPNGRLHFAGEHTALLQQGMEGAMESGERAAFEVMNRL